jgi:hypothetical protein
MMMSTIDKKYLPELEIFGERIEKMGKRLRLMEKDPEKVSVGIAIEG